ncbi:hypothetical protein D3C85_1904250 [compost metagenome]
MPASSMRETSALYFDSLSVSGVANTSTRFPEARFISIAGFTAGSMPIIGSA